MHGVLLAALSFCALLACGGASCRNNNWVQFQDSCYLFVDENVPWTSAEVICRVMGASLLEINSEEENDFIVQQMHDRNGIENVWLGMTDFEHEGDWLLMSSLQPPTYTNWGQGEPDNNPSQERGQDCVYIVPSEV